VENPQATAKRCHASAVRPRSRHFPHAPMKVTCQREKLREALAVINTVVPARGTKPILENLKLVATEDALELAGTDLEVSARIAVDEVTIEETGVAVIPCKVTLDFVRDLSSDEVTLVCEGDKCTIRGGTDQCELVTLDPDEFPVVSRFDDEGSFTLQGGNFSRLVQQTSFAAARDAGRYAMHGVLVEIAEDQVKMVATDGRRLALASQPIDAGGRSQSAIVPTKGLSLFARVIDDPLDPIKLSFDANQVGIRTPNAQIFARLIDGEFPRYSAVLPTETEHRMEADRDALAQKLRLVANVTGDDARAVRFKLGKSKLSLSGQSAGRGSAAAQLEVEYSGEGTEIAFNPDYVADGLKQCQSEVVALEFQQRSSPGKFTLGENYVYIVMPITIDA
jgi:DNA polymerase-3 subunit beta